MAFLNDEDRRAWFRRRYAANVAFVQEYKTKVGCTDCGYNKHHAGLEFDHVKPRLRGTVASQVGKSMRMILEEIERCEVVCGTCHNIRTWKRNN